MSQHPQVFVELHPSTEGCHMRTRIEGAPDGLSRMFVGVFASREKAISEATRWRSTGCAGWGKRG